MVKLGILVAVALAVPLAPPVRADTVATAAPQRVLGLQGAPNFRDLGGYRTGDGRQVRWGLVYRSNTLSALTPADIARVDAIGIGSLVDFRAADERRAQPDRWQPAFVYRSPKPSLAPLMREIMADPGTRAGVARGMRASYADMPEMFAPEYAALLHRLAASDRPLVMHCTAGKDRTGVAAAILLSLLGVPRATVVQDYLLTGRLLPAPAPSPAVSTDGVAPDAMAAALAADPAYLLAALDAIDRGYGSVEGYATRRLGLGPAEIAAIRARLLTPAIG